MRARDVYTGLTQDAIRDFCSTEGWRDVGFREPVGDE